ncbi:hypothetical protein ANO11243_093320 [Dothideomycetidae sp. 11243]|nr:hypothetical protein ANO11243_093320 [fungal sp. No.11243]
MLGGLASRASPYRAQMDQTLAYFETLQGSHLITLDCPMARLVFGEVILVFPGIAVLLPSAPFSVPIKRSNFSHGPKHHISCEL